jgi:hypothetical protein
VGGYPFSEVFLFEQENSVHCTPEFESARPLEVLAFEVNLCTAHPIDAGAGQDRRPVNESRNSPGRFPNFSNSRFFHRSILAFSPVSLSRTGESL